MPLTAPWKARPFPEYNHHAWLNMQNEGMMTFMLGSNLTGWFQSMLAQPTGRYHR
jgi:hypothetical protein